VKQQQTRKAPASGFARRGGLTEALEDYLEIILDLASRKRVVRVRDIARAKQVRMPTVISALKRLAEKELVQYGAGEYAELTPEGVVRAQQIAGRHDLLRRFLSRILGVAEPNAAHDACGIEHHLSAESLERLSAFIEYIETCPEVGEQFLERFRHHFGRRLEGERPCSDSICPRRPAGGAGGSGAVRTLTPLAQLPAGARAEVARLWASEEVRVALMERGLVPGADLEVAQAGGGAGPTCVHIHGQEICLAPEQAQIVYVDPAPGDRAGAAETARS